MMRMGANAVRTAHNPPAEALMELADELGLLVMSEITDVWREPKTPLRLRALLRRVDRARRCRLGPARPQPSLADPVERRQRNSRHAPGRGRERRKPLRRLMAPCAAHDPDGNAPARCAPTICGGRIRSAAPTTVKLIGYNYAEALYPEHHAAHPDWVIFGSESLATVQSRGDVPFPAVTAAACRTTICSARRWATACTSWGTKDLEADDRQRSANAVFAGAVSSGPGRTTSASRRRTKRRTPISATRIPRALPRIRIISFQAGWTVIRAEAGAAPVPVLGFLPRTRSSTCGCAPTRPAVELFLNGESLGKRALNGRLLADWQVRVPAGRA